VNRFAVVHDTRHVVLEGNVGYDTQSTGFFLEDDIERDPQTGLPVFDQVWETQNVVLRGNLALAVEAQTESVDLPIEYVEDLDSVNVSGFWIGHPNQLVEGNRAAGARGHGFYLAPGKNFSWTHDANEGSYFRNNVAHSNGQHGFYHQSRTPWAYNAAASNPAHRPAGEGLVAWKNRRYGIWWRTFGTSLLSGCKVADNKSGVYPASEGQQNAYGGSSQPATCDLTVADSLIVGFSANLGEMRNPAENLVGGAGRSLPQTYFHFTRSDGGEPHETVWDTINALEAYDGRNRFLNLRVANFPTPMTLPDPEGGTASGLLRLAGITQVEYNSRYAEDPRNSLEKTGSASWAFTNVANPVLYRPTAPGSGFSMIQNTILQDRAGILGYPTDSTVAYNDPFFSANQKPGTSAAVDGPRNLRIFDAVNVDFAQIEIEVGAWAGLPGTVEPSKMKASVRDAGGTLRSLTMAEMPPSSPPESWVFNAPLGVHANDPLTQQTGIYSLSFLAVGGTPADTPTSYDIKVQFCARADVPTILGLPFAGVPTTIVIDTDVTPLALIPKSSLSSLLSSSDPHAFYHDTTAAVVYIRTTTALFWSGTTVDEEGTRNVLHIQ